MTTSTTMTNLEKLFASAKSGAAAVAMTGVTAVAATLVAPAPTAEAATNPPCSAKCGEVPAPTPIPSPTPSPSPAPTPAPAPVSSSSQSGAVSGAVSGSSLTSTIKTENTVTVAPVVTSTATVSEGAVKTTNTITTEGGSTGPVTNTNGGNTVNVEAPKRFTIGLQFGNAQASGQVNGCAAIGSYNIAGIWATTKDAKMIEGCSEADLKKIGVAAAVVDPNVGVRVKGFKAAGIDMKFTQEDKDTVDALKAFEVAATPVTVPVIVKVPGPATVETLPCKVYGTKGANKGKLIDGVVLDTTDPKTGKTVPVCTGGGDEMAPAP